MLHKGSQGVLMSEAAVASAGIGNGTGSSRMRMRTRTRMRMNKSSARRSTRRRQVVLRLSTWSGLGGDWERGEGEKGRRYLPNQRRSRRGGFRLYHGNHDATRGLEEQISEALNTSKSFSELDLEDVCLDDPSHPCCAGGQREGDEVNQVEQQLKTVFSALKLTQFSNLVKEYTAFTYVSGALLLISAVITMKMGAISAAVSPAILSRVAGACLCSVYAILGVPAFIDVAYNLAAFKVDIHVLTLLAVFGTVVIGCPLEGALLLLLFETAYIIEVRLTKAAKGNLALLLEGAPKMAVVVEVSEADKSPNYDTERTTRVEEVQPGKYIVVKAGEIVPLDGRIVYGSSFITSENITGESLPYRKMAGDSIPAGARSVDGTIVLQTIRTSAESTPMRILKMTAAAQGKKPRISQFLDDWMNVYSRVILGCTFVVSLGLPLLGVSVLGPNGSLYRAAAFLTAAAPCALVMAPLAYVTSISAISRKGVLVKGGKVLDALSKCDIIALDKTGTLTEGELECTGITHVNGASGTNGTTPTFNVLSPSEDKENLGIALAVSQGSNHPISLAIKKCALESSAQNGFKIQDFRQIPGYGVEASAKKGNSSYEIQFGSINFVSKYLSDSSTKQITNLVKSSGQDKVIAVLHTKQPGTENSDKTSLFTFADKIRSKSASAVDDLQMLKDNELKVSMLTGDHEANALNVAAKLGISNVRAGLLPEDKVKCIEELRSDVSKSGYIAMVGDGINDAPALATADVGIAFADSTTAAAASAADAIVLKEGGDHISSLPYIFRVAHKTKRILKQNIALAMVSIIGTSLPSVAGYFPLWLSVSLHEGSTVLVALNSLRCLLPESRSSLETGLRYLAVVLVVAGCLLAPGFFSGAGFTFKYLPQITLSLGGLALMLESASAGLFAGALHSLAGPDHLAALAPLSMGRSSLAAGFLGGLWGFGHCMGQLFFGALFILLKSRLKLHLDLIENFAGVAVGFTLIGIGYIGFQEAKKFNFEEMKIKRQERQKVLSKFSLATFSTGFLHGLSPDAIFPILPAITLSSRSCAFAFVLAFLVGTIGSMASYTAFIGVGSSALAHKSPDITKKISYSSSAVAVLLGLVLIASGAFGVDLLALGGLRD